MVLKGKLVKRSKKPLSFQQPGLGEFDISVRKQRNKEALNNNNNKQTKNAPVYYPLTLANVSAGSAVTLRR